MSSKLRQYDPSALRWTVWDVSPATIDLGGQEAPQAFQAILDHPEWPDRANLVVVVDPDRGPIAAGLGSYPFGKDRAGFNTDVSTYRELDARLAGTTDLSTLLASLTADAVGKWHADRAKEKLIESLEHPHEMPPETALEILKGRSPMHDEVVSAALERARPRRRRVVTKQHLADVAQVYRQALDDGYPPTKRVAEHFVTSHSSAARWVGLAREAGLLGPATGTRPGEGELDG